MLKLTQIDGRDALTFNLDCGCSVTGVFPNDASAPAMVVALIEFANAVAKLDMVHRHSVAHNATDAGIKDICRSAGR